MDGVTARSRLRPPALPDPFTHRRRLTNQLDAFDPLPLTLICAGPGAGKTTLLADWAASAPRRPAWVALSPRDDSASTLWERVGAALESAGHPARRREFAALPHDDGSTAFLLGLQAALPAGRPVLIFDDAEQLRDPAVLRELDAVIRLGGARLRLILSSRHEPRLPLQRYRTSALVGEIRAPELALTPAEAQDVLAGYSISLTGEQLASLHRRTEGWVAGVRLSAMGAAGRPDSAAVIQQFALDHGSVGEYLAAEVLARQSAAERRLLIATSFLAEVDSAIAEALSEVPGVAGLLQELARTNSFVTAVDDAQTTFRYHPLLREILRHLLDRDGELSAPLLYRRASDWYLRAGDPLRALDHAEAAQDPGRVRAALLGGALAATVIEFGALGNMDQSTLAAVLAARGGLGAVGVGPVEVAAEHASALISLVQASEKHSVAEVDRSVRRVLATMDSPAGTQGALALRAAVLEIQARVHFWSSGEGQFPVESLTEAVRLAHSAGSGRVEVRSLALLELINAVRLDSGGDRFAERSRAPAGAHPELDRSATYHLAEVIRASVRLDLPAWRRSLDLAELRWQQSANEHPDPAIGWALIVMRSWLSLESGDAAQARAELLALEPAVASLPPMVLAARLQVLAEIETALGRPQSALNLLSGSSVGEDRPWLAIAAARAYLAQERTAPADQLLRPVLADAEGTAEPLQVTALLLSARSRQLQGADDSAERQVRRALELAGDDIRSPFVRIGVMLAGLLDRRPSLRRSWPADPRAEGASPAPVGTMRPELSTSLSPRELALLRRLGARMTNAEMARELLLSPNTVKSHLAALYQKLGAANRTDAVATARQHGLL